MDVIIVSLRNKHIICIRSLNAMINNTSQYDIDSNYYYNHYNTTSIFRTVTSPATNYHTFSSWKTATGADANSTMDNTIFTTETDTLLYNVEKTAQQFTISTGTWEYLDGSSVSFPVTIQPFESLILIKQ